MNSIVTNEHLKDVIIVIKDYFEKDEDAPVELIFKFICELKVSNLLIPGLDEEDAFSFEHIISEEDDSKFIPLFTDIEEYNKHTVEDEDLQPMAFDFEMYEELLLEDDELDGIIINVDGPFIPIDKDFVKQMSEYPEITFEDDVEGYNAGELKSIFENITNDSLSESIKKEWDIDDTEDLFVELSSSTLLNLVISEQSLDEFAKDGIISADDVDGFELCTIEQDGLRFGAIFTDKQAIEKAINPESSLYYYGQITHVSRLFDFILRTDMDGVVINPNSDDYVIVRDEILSQATGIEVVVDNPNFKNSLDYAFML